MLTGLTLISNTLYYDTKSILECKVYQRGIIHGMQYTVGGAYYTVGGTYQ